VAVGIEYGSVIKRNTLEAFVIVFLVLCLFLLLLRLFDFMFPNGTSIKDVVTESQVFRMSGAAKDKQYTVELGGESTDSESNYPVVANIQSLKNVVKNKPANAIAWETAKKGLSLRNRDAVQTYTKASATIAFSNTDTLILDSNSMIIINKINVDAVRQERQARIILTTGRLRSRIRASREYRKRVEVETGNIVTTVKNASTKQTTDFEVKVNPDQSSTITILAGEASVSSQGKSVSIKQNQAVTVTPGKPIPKPVYQPASVRTVTPKDNTLYNYHTVPRQVALSWAPLAEADSYDVIIAQDPDFRTVITNERIDRTTFSHNKLTEGTYYWKVRANIGWVEGVFSKTKVIKVVKEREPPKMKVNYPPATIAKPEYEMTGTTGADVSRIIINDVPVDVSPTGEFRHKVALKKGANIIVVESIDNEGNVKYETKMITYTGK